MTAPQRIHGRHGRFDVALDPTTPTVFTQIAFLSKWTITFDVPQADVTAMGDSNEIALAGLPKIGGQLTGFLDINGDQLYTPSRDGISRLFKLYPDHTNTPGTFWSGSATFSFHVDSDVKTGVGMSGVWVATTDVIKTVAP